MDKSASDTYRVLGLMSGTSLDGLDLAYCHFIFSDGSWSFDLREARTVNYEPDWKKRLQQATHLDAQEIHFLDISYAQWLSQQIKDFQQDFNPQIDFIASHGHTIFHQPERKMTLQIGAGWVMALETQLPVVANFRVKDVALGGQGAPLVPMGDHHLFSDYDFCLNLGGITNMSFIKNGERKAYDICPLNMALNFLAKILNYEYDKDGEIARQGVIQADLLDILNHLSYYQEAFPKSLSWEWFSNRFLPALNAYSASVPDKLATCVAHFSEQISRELINYCVDNQSIRVLLSGGGARNTYLVEKIREKLPPSIEIICPEEKIIDFKEALIFGFLGVLRFRNEVNCLASVTGASRDSCGGIIYQP